MTVYSLTNVFRKQYSDQSLWSCINTGIQGMGQVNTTVWYLLNPSYSREIELENHWDGQLQIVRSSESESGRNWPEKTRRVWVLQRGSFQVVFEWIWAVRVYS